MVFHVFQRKSGSGGLSILDVSLRHGNTERFADRGQRQRTASERNPGVVIHHPKGFAIGRHQDLCAVFQSTSVGEFNHFFQLLFFPDTSKHAAILREGSVCDGFTIRGLIILGSLPRIFPEIQRIPEAAIVVGDKPEIQPDDGVQTEFGWLETNADKESMFASC